MNKVILTHALELAAELEAQALLHTDALPDLQILNSFQTDARILFGHPESGILDSLKIVDLAKELLTFLSTYPADLLGDVAPEVLERVLQIATIDRAFLTTGKGVVEAAGITTATRAMAVLVSQSTGRVSLFKGGKTILVLDRPS